MGALWDSLVCFGCIFDPLFCAPHRNSPGAHRERRQLAGVAVECG